MIRRHPGTGQLVVELTREHIIILTIALGVLAVLCVVGNVMRSRMPGSLIVATPTPTAVQKQTPEPSSTPTPTPAAVATPTPTPAPLIGVVTVDRLRVRAGPGLDEEILGRLEKGEEVTVVGKSADGRWLQILYRKGKKGRGWVWAEYVDMK